MGHAIHTELLLRMTGPVIKTVMLCDCMVLAVLFSSKEKVIGLCKAKSLGAKCGEIEGGGIASCCWHVLVMLLL